MAAGRCHLTPVAKVGLYPIGIVHSTDYGCVIDMKDTTALIITLPLAAAFLVAGCKQKDTTTQQLDKAGDKTVEVAQDIKDYSFARKTEFVSLMKTELTDLNRDLDQLGALIASSSEAVKTEAQPKFAALRAQSALLGKQLDVAENSTESTWEVVKSDCRKSYQATQQGFQQSRQWLADKIAP